jgi:hypothetical protein
MLLCVCFVSMDHGGKNRWVCMILEAHCLELREGKEERDKVVSGGKEAG